MQLTVLSSGPLSASALHALFSANHGHDTPTDDVICITNSASDMSVAGLRFRPDTDAAVRALRAPTAHTSSATVASTLASLGLAPDGNWPMLDDENVAFAVARAYLQARGESAAEATRLLAPQSPVRILPATQEPVELHVVETTASGERSARHISRWLADPERSAPESFGVAGLDRATPSPGVLDALRSSDVVAILPMSPVLDAPGLIGVPGLRDALRGTPARVVVLSPVGLTSPRDPQAEHSAWTQANLEMSSAQVARLYGDFADELLIDEAEAPASYPKALRVRRVPLASALASDDEAARTLRSAVVDG